MALLQVLLDWLNTSIMFELDIEAWTYVGTADWEPLDIARVCHGLQLQSRWIIPDAAVS